jgi:Meckel syndrome type 1 protein
LTPARPGTGTAAPLIVEAGSAASAHPAQPGPVTDTPDPQGASTRAAPSAPIATHDAAHGKIGEEALQPSRPLAPVLAIPAQGEVFVTQLAAGSGLSTQGLLAEGRPEVRAPALDNIVENVMRGREEARAARSDVVLRHAEFGTVTARVELGAAGLTATLAARDPGFVPAVQAALQERFVLPAPDPAAPARGTEGGANNGGQGGGQSHAQASGHGLQPGSRDPHGLASGSGDGSTGRGSAGDPDTGREHIPDDEDEREAAFGAQRNRSGHAGTYA